MSIRDKLAVGLLKLGFGEFEAPLGSPVFDKGEKVEPARPGLKEEPKKEHSCPKPTTGDTSPPSDPRSPLDPMCGKIGQELKAPLPFMGEIGRYFRSLFVKGQ